MGKLTKKEARARRHRRLRRRISGTPEIPRMSVCCSGKHMYVQFIDDLAGHTLVSVSTVEKAFRESDHLLNVDGAAFLGKVAAEKALQAKITRVVFDRGGFRYHGRVKALADAAREAGLQF